MADRGTVGAIGIAALGAVLLMSTMAKAKKKPGPGPGTGGEVIDPEDAEAYAEAQWAAAKLDTAAEQFQAGVGALQGGMYQPAINLENMCIAGCKEILNYSFSNSDVGKEAKGQAASLKKEAEYVKQAAIDAKQAQQTEAGYG